MKKKKAARPAVKGANVAPDGANTILSAVKVGNLWKKPLLKINKHVNKGDTIS